MATVTCEYSAIHHALRLKVSTLHNGRVHESEILLAREACVFSNRRELDYRLQDYATQLVQWCPWLDKKTLIQQIKSAVGRCL